MPTKQWSSRIAFIITASSFAVGLGNIWRFPYITGENGGGAFLLVYIVLMVLIGIPLLTVEMSLGRLSRTSPLTAFSALGGGTGWNGIGWLTFLAAAFIKMYYVVILAWIVVYIFQYISGSILNVTAESLPTHFDQTISHSGQIYLAVFGILILAAIVVNRDLLRGLEPVARILMILLLALIVGLVCWSCTLPGTIEGLHFYLYPDFSKITMDTWVQALGQLFFSVGVAMVAAFIFGTYTDDKDRLISSAAWIAACDTGIALLAGFIIFPALFAFGLSPDSGPDLIFITLGSLFGSVAGGQILGCLFFILLFIAGFTSLVAVLQGLKECIVDRFALTADRSLVIIVVGILLGAIPMVLSFQEDPMRIGGATPYDIFDYLTNSIMLPLGALLLVFFAFHIVGFQRISSHLKIATKYQTLVRLLIGFVVPLAILVILLKAIIDA